MRGGRCGLLLLLLLGMPRTSQALQVQANIYITGAWTNMTTSSLALAGLPAYLELLIKDESSLTVEATSCLAGYYSYDDAQTCTACPAGKYSSTVTATGESTCISCESGKYSSTVGASLSSTCIDCPNSTYFEGIAGASLAVCLACPANSSSYQGSKLRQACVCLGGFQGPNGGACTPCNSSTFCQFGQANPCPPHSRSLPMSSSLGDCKCVASYYGDTTVGSSELTLCQVQTHKHILDSRVYYLIGTGRPEITALASSLHPRVVRLHGLELVGLHQLILIPSLHGLVIADICDSDGMLVISMTQRLLKLLQQLFFPLIPLGHASNTVHLESIWIEPDPMHREPPIAQRHLCLPHQLTPENTICMHLLVIFQQNHTYVVLELEIHSVLPALYRVC